MEIVGVLVVCDRPQIMFLIRSPCECKILSVTVHCANVGGMMNAQPFAFCKKCGPFFSVAAVVVVGLGFYRGPVSAVAKSSRGQGVSQGCVDGKAVIKSAWALEEELANLGMKSAPATAARTAYKKADEIGLKLVLCEAAAYEAHKQEEKEMYSAEHLNLQFMASAQIANGGLASLPNPTFPSDLGILAPACKDVVASGLPERIEGFAKTNRDTTSLRTRDVATLYHEANPSEGVGLTICAGQADDVGYKGASVRLLIDALSLESLMHIAMLNEQNRLITAVGSVRANVPVYVDVGPRHCTATVRDWGWQKTVEWDCF